MKRPKGKHTDIVNSIAKRLFNSSIEYKIIRYEETFTDSVAECCGECDVYAVAKYNGKTTLLLFEVKSTDRHRNKLKAHKQLEKDAAYFGRKYKADKIYKFEVYGMETGYSINRYKTIEDKVGNVA